MKKNLTTILCLFIAALNMHDANAQTRINKKYDTDDVINISTPHKKFAQTFLPAAISGYYFEGFENTFPPAGWQVIDVLDTNTTWKNSNTADYPASFEGLQSAYCRYEFSTPSGGEDWLITPKFTVAAGDSLMFQFKFEYMGYQPDSTFILVSTTDSALTSFTNVLDVIYDSTTMQIVAPATWYYKTYALNAFSGQQIYVAFKNVNNEGDGVFIDNVEMGTRPPAEAAAISIDMNDFYAAGNSIPKATVKNNGGITQTFNVTMNISGGYSSTKPVTLSPQASATVIFDPWNATVGTYLVNVQTFLSGDVNPANDTISKSIIVLEPFLNYGWSVHEPLVDPSFGASIASVNTASGSRLFTFGGYAQSTIVSETYEYDLAFSTWASATAMPTEATYAASATGNGKIFIVGGRTLGTAQGAVQIYNYATDTWTSGAPMPNPRVTAAFATYRDSLLYIFGGYSDANGTGTNLVQVYDMFNDAWSTATSFPGPALFSSRAGIIKNKIIMAGGIDGASPNALGTCYVGVIDSLNPMQITWTQTADYPTGKISRCGTSVSVDPNSTLVVFAAGNTGGGIVTDLISNTFAYDFNTNTWKLGPDKPTERNLFYMAPIVYNDSVYLVATGGNPPGANLFHSDDHEWLNMGHYQFPTVINDADQKADIRIFPNPVNDIATLIITVTKPAAANIKIKDMLGNEIKEIKNQRLNIGFNRLSLPIKNLANGVYVCSIEINGSVLAKKLIKN